MAIDGRQHDAEGAEAQGPFHPDRSTFAHAGRPEGVVPSARAKPGVGSPILVSRSETVSSMPAERILHGLRGTNVTVAYQDTDLIYNWIANPPAGFETIAGRRDVDILPDKAADMLVRAKRACVDEGVGAHLLVDVDGDARRWFDIWLEPDVMHADDGTSSVEGVIVVAIDVTDRVVREERLRVLLREVSHRTRNLLAIVQSIASQTVRAAAAPSRFLDRFTQRLQSLAHTLDLVTLREWEGATLHQLVSRQASPFQPDSGSIEIGGVDPVLTPNAALHLGLAVQELASNALSHGAWREADGHVAARTRRDPDGDGLLFEWLESGTGSPKETNGGTAKQSGSFGSRTLMAIVPAAIDGEASMVSQNEGFAYRLRIPPANFDR